jgi:hypothetical protein
LVVPALAHLTGAASPAPDQGKELAVDDIAVADDAKEREEIRSLLAGGLETEVFPRADTHEEVMAIVARLQAAQDDLKVQLVIAGFTLKPIDHDGIEQACETCMYYKVHRRYCELPELEVPVEPEWSCRLWRI